MKLAMSSNMEFEILRNALNIRLLSYKFSKKFGFIASDLLVALNHPEYMPYYNPNELWASQYCFDVPPKYWSSKSGRLANLTVNYPTSYRLALALPRYKCAIELDVRANPKQYTVQTKDLPKLLLLRNEGWHVFYYKPHATPRYDYNNKLVNWHEFTDIDYNDIIDGLVEKDPRTTHFDPTFHVPDYLPPEAPTHLSDLIPAYSFSPERVRPARNFSSLGFIPVLQSPPYPPDAAGEISVLQPEVMDAISPHIPRVKTTHPKHGLLTPDEIDRLKTRLYKPSLPSDDDEED